MLAQPRVSQSITPILRMNDPSTQTAGIIHPKNFSIMLITMKIICFAFFSAAAAAKSLQSCPTLCDPIDGSLPGSLVPEILQARTLEWVAISFSRGSF